MSRDARRIGECSVCHATKSLAGKNPATQLDWCMTCYQQARRARLGYAELDQVRLNQRVAKSKYQIETGLLGLGLSPSDAREIIVIIAKRSAALARFLQGDNGDMKNDVNVKPVESQKSVSKWVDNGSRSAVNVNDTDHGQPSPKTTTAEEHRQSRRRQVREMLKEGKTYAEIMTALKCTRKLIRSVAKEAGIRRTGHGAH